MNRVLAFLALALLGSALARARWIARRSRGEGFRRGGPPRRIGAAHRALAVSLAFVGLVAVGLLVPGSTVVALPLAVTGAALPDLVVARRRRRWRRNAVAELPWTYELVAAALTAGATLEEALGIAARAAEPPVRQVLGAVVARIAAGDVPTTALLDEARRCELVELERMALAVRRAWRLGLPLAADLRAAADDLHARRRSSILVEAGRATAVAAVLTAVVVAPSCVASLAVLAVATLFSDHGGGG